MPANVQPIFPITPIVTWAKLTTANTAHDGTGTVATVFTAGTNGARVDRLKIRPMGTGSQTVLRVFINNGADSTTATNNILYSEKTIIATTSSETESLDDYILPLDIALPASYKINCTLGTTVAPGIAVTCEGGNF